MDRVLVLDGHDGCGKTTLGRLAAQKLGASYVRPFPDTLGDHIAWLWRSLRFDEADALARSAVERVIGTGTPGEALVFDRHWATMFTVLPESYWPGWGTLPPTVICDAPSTLVMERLAERGEHVGDRESHEYYQNLYRRLADRCDRSLVVDTGVGEVATNVTRIVAFARDCWQV
jgi:thymidylate kinase